MGSEVRPILAPPLEALFDPGGRAGELTSGLRRSYGSDLGFDEPIVYANLVASIDGVAAERSRPRSSADISGREPGDRFVMGLLRASADAVVVGAGTFRAHEGGTWRAEDAYPPASKAFARLRALRGAPRDPRLVVLSASGDILSSAALHGSVVFTSEQGAARLPPDVIGTADVRVLDVDGRGLDLRGAIEALRAEGYRRILTEGGPRLLGAIIAADALDELFLTVSPIIAGRSPGDDRPGIVDGLSLQPVDFRSMELLSLRRGGSFLFLRYRASSEHPSARRAS